MKPWKVDGNCLWEQGDGRRDEARKRRRVAELSSRTTGPQVITSVHSSWQANSLGKVWRFSVQACGLHHIACYH